MEQLRAERVQRNLREASCCNCLAFVFAFFISLSPYYLYSYGTVYRVGDSASVQIATAASQGSFVLSSISGATLTSAFPKTYVSYHSQRTLFWSDVTSELACTDNSEIFGSDEAATNIFSTWSGKYGYCDRIGGTFTIPTEAIVLQVFTSLTAACPFLAFLVGLSVNPSRYKLAKLTGFFCLLGMISAIVLSSAASSDLAEGNGVLPVLGSINGTLVLTPFSIRLYKGPSFYVMITLTIMMSYTSIVYCFPKRTRTKYDDPSVETTEEGEFEPLIPDEEEDYRKVL